MCDSLQFRWRTQSFIRMEARPWAPTCSCRRSHMRTPMARFRARTVVANNGEFHLDVPPVDSPWAGMIGTETLWAYKFGFLVSSIPVYKGALPSDLPQRLVLGPPTRAQFQILCPDGTAVAGAMIEPRVLDRHIAQAPDRLSAMIGAESTTDFHGRALMTAFFPEEITGVRVTAQGFGQQEF